MIKKECLICKKEYLIKESKKDISKYCSSICRVISLKGKPSWSKGLTKETDIRVKQVSDKLKKYYKENPNPKCGFKKGHKVHPGKKLSEKHKKNISIGMNSSQKFKDGVKSKVRSLKLSKALKGRKFSEEWLKKLSDSRKGILTGDKNPSKRPEVRKKISEYRTGKTHTNEMKERMSKYWKQRWTEDKEFVKKWRESIDASPNKKEIFLINFFKQHNLPFEFVGDFKVNIGGSFPDFIHKNKLIELFGNYWHKKEEEKQRIEHFKNYGYECLVIWENELKDETKLLSKINSFTN